MREIGIRELKAHLSEALRQVSAGEQLRVTLRGQAIADIVPVDQRPEDEQLRALIAAGKITPPSRPHPEKAPRLVEAEQSALELVLDERDDER